MESTHRLKINIDRHLYRLEASVHELLYSPDTNQTLAQVPLPLSD
jgi:hypothetical protein